MALKKKNRAISGKKAATVAKKKPAARPDVKAATRKAPKPPVKPLKAPAGRAAKAPVKSKSMLKSAAMPAAKAAAKTVTKPPVKSAARPAAKPSTVLKAKPAIKAIKPAAQAVKPVIQPPVSKPVSAKGKPRASLKASAGGRALHGSGEAQPYAEKDSQIDAFCPRCKTETSHKVSVMLGPKIRRIRCGVCGTEHNYHRSQLLKLRSVRDEIVQAKRRKEEESESKGLEKMYEEQMIGRDPKLAKVFSIKDKYYLEDLVNHPLFGTGLVTRIKEDGKIEVLFKSGLRLLVHNRFATVAGKKG